MGDRESAVISVEEGKNPPPQLLSRTAAKSPAATLPHHISFRTLAVLIVPKVDIVLQE